MSNLNHGDSTKHEQPFTQMFTAPVVAYDREKLFNLAASMADKPDSVKDGADPEENGVVPAGYAL